MDLYRDLLEFICLFLDIIAEMICAFYQKFQFEQLPEILKYVTETQVLEWVFWYNRNMIQLYHYLKHVYNEHKLVKWSVDGIDKAKNETVYVFTHFFRFATQRNCEPYADNWISFYRVADKDANSYINYVYLDDFCAVRGGYPILHVLTSIFMGRYYSEYMFMTIEDSFTDNYNQSILIDKIIDSYVEETLTDETTSNIPTEILITRKYNNAYYYDVLRLMAIPKNDAPVHSDCASLSLGQRLLYQFSKNAISASSEDFNPPEKTLNSGYVSSQYKDARIPSDVRLLVIQYIHPEMNYVVDIKLDENAYYEGNEILSVSFIRCYLNFLPIWYSFKCDDKYILNIMDDNIHQFTLKPNQSILLHTDKYEILTHT